MKFFASIIIFILPLIVSASSTAEEAPLLDNNVPDSTPQTSELMKDTIEIIIGDDHFTAILESNAAANELRKILLVLDGEGYQQLEGQPRQMMKKGDVIRVPANTRHWHGATENNSLTQMYILPKTENGIVTWLEPVTDEQYKSNN